MSPITEESLLKELIEIGYKPLEGEGPKEKWSIDGPEAAFYLRDMLDIMEATNPRGSHTTFSAMLEDRISRGENTHVLDLFGSGFFVVPPEYNLVLGVDVQSVTGMRYGAFNREQMPAKFPMEKYPTEILGDIFQPETWQKLDQSMQERGIPKMDLVAMRPFGAWDQSIYSRSVRGNYLALAYVLKNVAKRLSPTGRFYFSLVIPQLEGVLGNTPEFQQLVQHIEKATPFRLVLISQLSLWGKTYQLEGALVPK